MLRDVVDSGLMKNCARSGIEEGMAEGMRQGLRRYNVVQLWVRLLVGDASYVEEIARKQVHPKTYRRLRRGVVELNGPPPTPLAGRDEWISRADRATLSLPNAIDLTRLS